MSAQIEKNHLEKLKAGHRSGLRYIYNCYHKRIYFYCQNFLYQDTLAQEATADVFIKLWQKREIIDSSKTIAPFLFKLAKDIAYNYLKKIAADQSRLAGYLERYPLVERQEKLSGEQSLISKEVLANYHQAVEMLPAKRKAIFKMRYEEELDYQSIAERLQISPNTVKVQLVRARKFLKDQLAW